MTPPEILARIPYANFLGAVFDREGEAWIARLPFREGIVGNAALPALHGGAVGGFLELAGAVILVTETDSERVPKPINFSIDYLRSAKAKDLRARVEIVKLGRQIANVRVTAWQDEPDRPVSIGRGNFLF